jgi:hypothetical protein
VAKVFAGPLARFYARGGADVVRVRAGVEAWRETLRAAVAPKVAAELAWDEGAEVAREWDVDASGWPALRLFALYAERSELEMPDTVPALLELDAEWRAAADEKFARSKYGQLLACSVWLPGDFPVTLRAPMPDGETAEIGSLAVLADQLQWLNQRTFAAGAEEVARWAELPAPPGAELLAAARRGYAGLRAAVAIGTAERVPVVVEGT